MAEFCSRTGFLSDSEEDIKILEEIIKIPDWKFDERKYEEGKGFWGIEIKRLSR